MVIAIQQKPAPDGARRATFERVGRIRVSVI
jgi:hypothetical protein